MKSGRLNANDYFLNRQYLNQQNNLITDYISITPSGEIEYVLRQEATPFNFWMAKNLKQALKTFAPQIPIQLEIVNPALIN